MKNKNIFINFFNENILYCTYVIICVLICILLRILTIGNFITFKAFINDTLIICFLGSFGYKFSPNKRHTYFLSLIIFLSIISVINTIYYQFYKSFISINLLGTVSMVGQVNDSLFAKLHFNQFIYLIFILLYILIIKYLNNKKYIDNQKKPFKPLFLITTISLIILITFYYSNDRNRFVNQYNRESLVSKYGLYLYTINDLVQSIKPRINNYLGYDQAANTFREYYSCKISEAKEINEYTDIYKDKNVIFIHGESIQNFLINLKINGEEVTPNLNKLIKQSTYFSKFYPQISVGTSSDTEFTLSTGLLPSSSGTVFVNYYDREFKSIQNYFNEMGYYTFSMHANDADYWNRKTMYKTLGYQDFYSKENYEIPEKNDKDYIGLGLSDKSFFKQSIPILKNIKQNNNKYFGTIITLSNHSPFSSVDKYGDFKVTMDYEYKDENGNTIKSEANYLEGTQMGNYLKSAHYADEALGELLNELEENNLLENTILIFYGDHEARIDKNEFELLYNYDPITDSVLDKDDENYISMDNYNYDLLKNTPLIIYDASNKESKQIDKVMGMYDVLPTLANMFGFIEDYSLGNDVFSNKEGFVVFPNGNILTDKIYYSDSNDEYITISNEPISSEYLDDLKEQASKIIEVSNGILKYDLIKNEGNKIGECKHE